MRKSESALRSGEQVNINNDDPDVFAFVRRSSDETVVVALNMSAKPRTIQFDWQGVGVHGSKLAPLYYSSEFSTSRWDRIDLAPFAAFVARIEIAAANGLPVK